jgi:hypothetical protein
VQIKAAEEIQRHAAKYDANRASEDSWSHLFFNHFFDPLRKTFEPREEDSR